MNLKNNPLVKIAIVSAIALLLLIPSKMTESLVHEREGRRWETESEVQSSWSSSQDIVGPILSIPIQRYEIIDGKRKLVQKNVRVLPKELNAHASLSPEVRYRGIFKVPVYQTKIDLRIHFDRIEEAVMSHNPDTVLWNESNVCIALTDLRGINNPIVLEGDTFSREMNPGMPVNFGFTNGVFTEIDARKLEGIELACALDLNGSQHLMLAPVGRTTEVKMESSWPDPSFIGSFLPDQREIGDEGFQAEWKVLHLNRNYPQNWIGNRYSLSNSMFGTALFSASDHYQKTNRATKYAIMFIVLSFAAFFLYEILKKQRIHPIQYLLVGGSLVVFYVLLLGFSEHMGFNPAYFVSLLLILLLNFIYLKSVLGSTSSGLIGVGLFGMMYTFLFVVLQLTDYALIFGSIGLFITLAAIMILSRKVDWYGKEEEE